MSSVEKAYQEYKQRRDKTKVINGKLYYRIVFSEFLNLTNSENGYLLVVPSPDMLQEKNIVYQDENGNHFSFSGHNHIRFAGKIPEWYLECGECNMKWKETSSIGKYLTVVE